MESHEQVNPGCVFGGVTRQFATDAMVCTVSWCHDSWCLNVLDSRSSEISVPLDVRRRVKCFGKHLRIVFSCLFCLLSRQMLHR